MEKGNISQEEYDHAEETCRKLYTYLLENREAVTAWCTNTYRELRTQLV